MRRGWVLTGIAAALVGFWVIDIPQTVRLKVALLKVLPLSPEYLNSSIHSLCAGAHEGPAVSTCYGSFYSRDAAEAIDRKQTCAAFAKRLEAGDKDWFRTDDDESGAVYVYGGSDKAIQDKFGPAPFFYSGECEIRSLTGRWTME